MRSTIHVLPITVSDGVKPSSRGTFKMKYLIITTLLASVFSVCAMAEESEHNYKAKIDDWEYTYRHREGRWHVEAVNKIGPVEVMYRYADQRSSIENRIKFTWAFLELDDLTVEGRMEYRHFDNKESHWRYRFITEYTPRIYKNFHLYVKWQPRWALKDAGAKFDSRDQLGITYKKDNWKITPFIERNGTEGYGFKQTVYGTHFEIKL